MSELPIKRSDNIGTLVGALAAAQLDFGEIQKNRENTYNHTWYADLADVIAATRPALAKNGLVIIQVPIYGMEDRKVAGAYSMLVHSSGEFISTELLLSAEGRGRDNALKLDTQTVAAAVTYAKRYTWQSLIGVAAEEDDDAQSLADRSNDSKAVDAPKPKQVKAPEVNRAPAKQDLAATRPNEPKAGVKVPNAVQPSPVAFKPPQTNDPTPVVDSGVPKAVIPPEAPVVPSQSETVSPANPVSTVAEISSPSEHSVVQNPPNQGVSLQTIAAGTVPNKTQFDGYTARAMALKQPLEKAGLKPSKNLTTGAKLKAFLLSTTGARELTDLTTDAWEKFLIETEGAVKTDAAQVVAQIEGGVN